MEAEDRVTLRKTVPGFNFAARGTPFAVLTDLDTEPLPRRTHSELAAANRSIPTSSFAWP